MNGVYIMCDLSDKIKHGSEWERKFELLSKYALELFIRDGENMSLRELAGKLEISPGAIYRYVLDKRDLWFLCQNIIFAKMSEDFDKIAIEAQGDTFIALKEISNYLLNLAEFDFPRFRFMFIMGPPISKKPIGTYETKCQKIGIKGLHQILETGINNGQIKLKKDHIKNYIMILWGFILGPGILISPLYDHFFIDQKMGWKKKFRKEVIDLCLKIISE